jgi:protein-disulfide isomerase
MKQFVTLAIIVIVGLGVGFYLFKISPSEQQSAASSYNLNLNTSDFQKISIVPPFDPATDKYQGDPKAKNVFIEYADYQCPGCASYSPILKPISTDFKDTVFVFRYFPLVQIHKNATEAAVAAESAGAQGKYWEMHDILFAKQGEWENLNAPLETFAAYAKSVGVENIDQFKNDVTSKKFVPAVQNGYNQAMGLNLPGTPSFFFNGNMLKPEDYAGLKKQSEVFLVK